MIHKISFSLAVLTASLLFTGAANAEVNAESNRASEALVEFKAFRKENGLPPVKITFKLSKAAFEYAAVMAKKDQMGHSVNGTTPKQRLDAVGYKYAKYFENVAWNQGNANPGAQAVKSWKESTSGHREAMLNPEVTQFGIGAAKSASGKWYFCLVLGKPR
ncbi:MAG: CAP domain-containing protein [Planctomycetes bacterium]|nr:CAP domain-containing protein [Planctomycetota bacterium]